VRPVTGDLDRDLHVVDHNLSFTFDLLQSLLLQSLLGERSENVVRSHAERG
jgi:hypothetical protein